MDLEEAAYHELCAYTLQRGDATFIHQHVVDAFAAQRANAQTKPIAVAFSLAGLYLHVEKGFSGRQVQRAHMQLARQKRAWPTFVLPADRGALTAVDVMKAPARAERDAAIHKWCASVWGAFAANRNTIVQFLEPYGLA
jgi:Family of unknown function (DUF5946)